jgi:hypothetical protein
MTDPNAPTDPATASQPGAAAPAAFDPASLPPEAVAYFEAEKRKASDAAAAAARRDAAGKAKPATAPTLTPAAPPAAADDVTAILALRDAFDDAAGDLPLKASQRSLMREAAMRDRPQDMSAWVSRYVERAGWSSAGSPAPQPAVPGVPAVTPAPAVPATHRAPPPPTPAVTESTPILSMSPVDREALVARIGVDEFNKRLMPELVRARVPFPT